MSKIKNNDNLCRVIQIRNVKMKLNVVAAGGAGISISDKVITKIGELGSGFASVDKYYIDSSYNNIHKIN